MKGLDFALLHKVRSEIDRRPEDDDDAEDFDCYFGTVVEGDLVVVVNV